MMDGSRHKPLITIVMSTHNRSDLLLRRSIPSVLRQTYDNWELLIRGDGTGRDTELAINSFGDPRIGFKKLGRRTYGSPREQWCVGGAHALNDALEDARGDYIAHLDDDDELLPRHLEVLSALLAGGRVDVVYGRAHVETNLGWVVFGEPFDVAKLQRENLTVHSAVMYDRTVLGNFRYDTEGVEPADWRLWRRIAASGARFGFSDEIVVIHYAEDTHRRIPRINPVYAVANAFQEHGVIGFARRMTHRRVKRAIVTAFTAARKPHVLGSDAPTAGVPARSEASGTLKLNVGSGVAHRIGPDWTNVDLLYGADVRADVRKGLPYDDKSIDFIYSEHFIEHLSTEEAQAFFKECYRVLKRGGVTRVATIDLLYLLERYRLDWSDQTWLRNYRFETACEMLNAAFYMWKHRFIYDEETLRLYVERSGSWSIERCGLGGSRHSALRHLETRPESRLILEAVKE